MEFTRVVRERRSVRHFTKQSVEQKFIVRILNVARHAPSAGFTQGASFVVVTRTELKQAIADICQEQVYVQAGYHPYISEAPVLLIACTSEQAYRDRYQQADVLTAEETNEVDTWPIPYWHMDLGCAVMLVALAAVDEGLATGFAAIYDVPALRQLLHLPTQVTPGLAIALGYSAPDVRWSGLDRGRKTHAEYIHYETW